jgi:hypothetical protein
MWIRCLFGFHRRSRGQAHEEDSRLVSRCSGCGIAMEKVKGQWMVLDKRDQPGVFSSWMESSSDSENTANKGKLGSSSVQRSRERA